MKIKTGLASIAIAALVAGTIGSSATASWDSDRGTLKGVTLNSYVYVDSFPSRGGCRDIRTHAKTTSKVTKLENIVSFSHLGVGVGAAMKGAGLSVSHTGTTPSYSWPVKRNATFAGGSLRLCNGDRYFKVHSTGIATINGSPLIVQSEAWAL